MKTLQEILNETEESDVKGALRLIASSIKDESSRESEKIWKSIESLSSAVGELRVIADSILKRPDPVFPEVKFPERVLMDKPEWYREPEKSEPINYEAIGDVLENRTSKHFDAVIERTANEHQSTREILDDILNKEPEYREEKKEPLRPAVNMGSVHKHSRWIRASTAKGNIVGSFDGINKVFRLPSAVIPESETIKLNGGVLNVGDDYTIAGNTITFSASFTAPVQGSTLEVRYQT